MAYLIIFPAIGFATYFQNRNLFTLQDFFSLAGYYTLDETETSQEPTMTANITQNRIHHLYTLSKQVIYKIRNSQGLTIARAIETAADGACGFRAIVYALTNGEIRDQEHENVLTHRLRDRVCDYLMQYFHDEGVDLELLNLHLQSLNPPQPTVISLQQYINKMRKKHTYIDDITLGAIGKLFKVNITILTDNGITSLCDNPDFKRVVIFFNGVNHYSAIELYHNISAEELCRDYKQKLEDDRLDSPVVLPNIY